MEQVIEIFYRPEIHQSNRWYGKYYEKVVVLFKSALTAVVVMVSVQEPKETVHDIFVDNPSCPFHQCKCDHYD